MSQPMQVLPKLTVLDSDWTKRSHIVALPSIVGRSDAESFRQFVSQFVHEELEKIFEFKKDSARWIIERGLTAEPGITPKSAVIIIAHDLFDVVKRYFNEWIPGFLEARRIKKENESPKPRATRTRSSLPQQLQSRGRRPSRNLSLTKHILSD